MSGALRWDRVRREEKLAKEGAPASVGQIDLIRKLRRERGAEGMAMHMSPDITFEQARAMIDTLKALPARPAYSDYLHSSAWRRRRMACFKRDGFRCVNCGRAKCLEAHHKTYSRIGNEDLDDLVTLCSDCHSAQHGIVRP